MSPPFDLGKITNAPDGRLPPRNILAPASSPWLETDQQIGTKAAEDAAKAPSIWFVDFPTREASQQQELLAKHKREVHDFRSWASLAWWKAVYNQSRNPQDTRQEAVATRNATCAKIAINQARKIPWLDLENYDDSMASTNRSKAIECSFADFHSELIRAVLVGFVDVTPNTAIALERFMRSLCNTLGQGHGKPEERAIFCQRYEYIPQDNRIRSYVRLISFSVSDESIRNIQRARESETNIKCAIEFNGFDAAFQDRMWNDHARGVEERTMRAANEFCQQHTINCPL